MNMKDGFYFTRLAVCSRS